jgi:hypothetical protein
MRPCPLLSVVVNQSQLSKRGSHSDKRPVELHLHIECLQISDIPFITSASILSPLETGSVVAKQVYAQRETR